VKHVLVTNDDGYHAPGLEALVARLSGRARITIVAPAGEASAVAHAITFTQPLVVHEISHGDLAVGYAVDGTPADCIKIALVELLSGERPDLVMSGINNGANVGVNVLYSGTVAAALEAAIFGIPAIAVSVVRSKSPRYAEAADVAVRIAEALEAEGELTGALNVNVPDLAADAIAGVRVARQRLSVAAERFHRRRDPRGRTYFWMDEPTGAPADDPASDAAALAAGYVTVTPVGYDLTDSARFRELEGFDWAGLAAGRRP
jgi:5'-nucleotidase